MDKYNNIIVLRSAYGKVNQKIFLQPAKNPQTRQFPNHIKSVDNFGNMILSESDKEKLSKGIVFIPDDELIEVYDGVIFDLENPIQLAHWEAIKYSKLIAPDRYSKEPDGSYSIDGAKNTSSGSNFGTNKVYGIAELYIEHKGREAVIKASKKEQIFKANGFIYQDSMEGRRNICRILGKNPERITDPDVTNYLTEIAEKDPERIIDIYTGGDMHLRLLFVDARAKGIIKVKDKLYVYGEDIILGATDESVIMYFKNSNNKNVLDMIKRDTSDDLEIDNPNAIILESKKVKKDK